MLETLTKNKPINYFDPLQVSVYIEYLEEKIERLEGKIKFSEEMFSSLLEELRK